ncbi:MAG: type II toxin-antitoxin system RelE/ParE family toxin [Bacteroidota bacterium]
MQKRKFEIKPSFIKSFKQAYDWYLENFGETYAKKFLTQIDESFEEIENEPLAFSECPELSTKHKYYRYFVYLKNHKIIFKVTANTISILLIFHCKRNPVLIKKMIK